MITFVPNDRRTLTTIDEPFYIFRDQPNNEARDALYIDCSQDDVEVYVLPEWKAGASYEFSKLTQPLNRVDAQQKLLELAMQCGLTKEEAIGLEVSWRQELSEREGKRIVSFMSERQYSNYCPIRILPEPTTMCRVGIILTPIE